MMEEELKTIFDKITKKIAEEEDNAIAKAFTIYIADLLKRNGIEPILTNVESPYEECSSANEYRIVSRYGYMFEWLDTSDHDKQIRDEVIEEFKKLIYEMAYDTDVQFFSNDIMISICGSSIDKIVEKMKVEQNERD